MPFYFDYKAAKKSIRHDIERKGEFADVPRALLQFCAACSVGRGRHRTDYLDACIIRFLDKCSSLASSESI